MEMQETDVLPEKRNRNPVIYAVVYNGDGGLQIQEEPTRADAKKFVNELPDPSAVVKIYRVSQVNELKQKVVVTF